MRSRIGRVREPDIVTNDASESPIYYCFSDERLFTAQVEPWFTNIVNHIVIGEMPGKWNEDDRDCFLPMVWFFIWEDPYLLQYFPD